MTTTGTTDMAFPLKGDDQAVADGDRRRTDRRRRDRRKAGNRINKGAPRASLMKMIGAVGLVAGAAVAVICMVASIRLGISIPLAAVSFQIAAAAVFAVLMALGSIELRLIEIRLELMMLNGGMRQSDRRQAEDRRGPRLAA